MGYANFVVFISTIENCIAFIPLPNKSVSTNVLITNLYFSSIACIFSYTVAVQQELLYTELTERELYDN